MASKKKARKARRPQARRPQKISSSKLLEMIKDSESDDRELAKYFKLSDFDADGFSPNVVVDQSLIEDDGREGAQLLNAANGIARWRRNRRYRKRVKNWTGVKIVAEGDSWFQYPLLLKDTIDQLADLDKFRYAIFGLSEAGDLLSNIIAEDELTQAIERENPDVFLISGGGNDMVGNKRLATLVHDFKAGRKAVDYPNNKFDEFLIELSDLYRGLFTRLLQRFPHLKIVCHGYDNAIPAGGNWLGKPLTSKNITAAKLRKDIIAEMIRRFNEALIEVAGAFPGAVFHADCRGIVGAKAKWHDELHPKDDGYFLVAQVFDQTIKRALSDQAPSPELEAVTTMLPSLSVGAKALTGLQELEDVEFASLVVARAEETMEIPIAPPKNKIERRAIESNLEKISKSADFLPSSFLEIGVARAQSVCRISTEVPLGTAFGSGFLVGSRNYIMTNNHVLPDVESAESASVEFDYDQDTVEYQVSLRPDIFFITSEELDFTIVASDPSTLPSTIEAVKIPKNKHLITRNERVNIVQHPQGRRKEIAIHDNTVTYVYDKAIRYTADTEGGSSGSPVFNNEWQLCALHHAGWKNDDGSATNEGIRVSVLVEHLLTVNDPGKVTHIERILRGESSSETAAPDRLSSEPEDSSDITINLNSSARKVIINVNE